MHNGEIAEFLKIRRKLQALLNDEIFDTVKGNTGKWHGKQIVLAFSDAPSLDSEWAFALFLSKVELAFAWTAHEAEHKVAEIAPRPERQLVHFPHPQGRNARDDRNDQPVSRRRWDN